MNNDDSDETLFNMESVKRDSPRLELIRHYDIQTYYCPHAVERRAWIAVPMQAARECLVGSDLTDDQKRDIVEILMWYCRLLEEWGMVFYGSSKREVENAALVFCSERDRAAGLAVTAIALDD